MATDFIIGVPSGQVIYTKPTHISKLKALGYIQYNATLLYYIFKDETYERILNLIKDKDDSKSFVSIQESAERFFEYQANVQNYFIHPTGKVDVTGSVHIKKPTKFPFEFARISGDFIVKNAGIETLKGFPDVVGGDFIISGNLLTTLEFGPSYVGRSYDCSDNFLRTIEGTPDIIKGDFYCQGNYLLNLRNGPTRVMGIIDCRYNVGISLRDAPICTKIISK